MAGAASANTVTQTQITSPSDLSYFYDSTNGAYGAVTVTGTTNSTDPASDTVDIDCYAYSGGVETDEGTLTANVALDSSGDFTTSVSYASIEQVSGENNECVLRAVPAGTQPSTGLSSYAGPRVLLAELTPTYDFSGSLLTDYELYAPGLGAADDLWSAGDAGLNWMSAAMPGQFGAGSDYTFEDSDSLATSYHEYGTGSVLVDGSLALPAAQVYDSTGQPGGQIQLSTSQGPAAGEITIHESNPLVVCSDANCYGWTPAGVTDDRTIVEANDGKLVLITDSFHSTSGTHTVVDNVGTEVNLGSAWNKSDPLLFSFPGASGDQSLATLTAGGNASVGVPDTAPATIYAYNAQDSAEPRGAVTYFTVPDGGQVGLPASDSSGYTDNAFTLPFTLDNVGANPVSVSVAYSTEYNQADFGADIATATDLQSPPMIAITSPQDGATVAAGSQTVTGVVSATTGVRAVTVNGVTATLNGTSFSATVPLTPGANTIAATVTSNAGVDASTSESVTFNGPYDVKPGTQPIQPQSQSVWPGATWHPIANTGGARSLTRHGAHSGHTATSTVAARLGGRVTPGSGSVSYYFQYGTGHRFQHRTRARTLAAGKSSRGVAVTINGLHAGTTYHYRLVATGKYGKASGRTRSFRAR